MTDMPRVSTVMWPTVSWPQAGELWREAEELGFHTAWLYDHIAWRGNRPWYDAFSTLAAAAVVTSQIRLGTLVTSPNFRHPIPTAHAVRTIDHISCARLRLGVGAGGTSRSSDGGVLGGPEWTPAERAERFAEWVWLLDRLLVGPETTYDGVHYSARGVVTDPGCLQQPRVPFLIAAKGPRGMRLAARYGAGWVTTGGRPDQEPTAGIRAQLDALDAACEAEGRDPATLERVLLTGFTGEPWLASSESFADLAGRYGELGFAEIVLHWPRERSEWDGDLEMDIADLPVFLEIAASLDRG